MPLLRRKHVERAFLLRQILPWLGLALLILVPVALSYRLAMRGPRKLDYVQPLDKGLTEDAFRQLSDEIAGLEKQFTRRIELGPADDETLGLLTQAIGKQKSLQRLRPSAGFDQEARLRRLETALDTARAQHNAARLDELVRAADDDRKAGLAEAALGKLRTALQLQRDINSSYASALYKNIVREKSLQQEIDSLGAEPLLREVEEALAAARTAVAGRRWAEALQGYTRARDAQARLNRNYAQTRYPDVAALNSLDAEIASLNTISISTDMETEVQAAGEALAAKRWSEAAERYGKAYRLQYEINQKFARSRFVSIPRLEELEVSKQSALSARLAEEAADLDREAIQLLQRRQVVAAGQKITLAAKRLDEVSENYPKSRNIDRTLKLKLAYLQLHHAELGTLQDQLYDQLVPLPGGAKNLSMLKTELSQSLYAAAMNNNPSHNSGRSLPVDSVTWAEAQECCRRLGWILGRTVRLPTEGEFRAAVGSLTGVNLGAIAWSEENSTLKSQPAGRSATNAVGFNDLLGNLAEWLQPATADSPTAPLAGGNYQDKAEALRGVPVLSFPKEERARTSGFRMVVEFTPGEPEVK